MMEKRRHSVDVPITKALTALRRVKSLKDPSTHSMSKFSSLFEDEVIMEFMKERHEAKVEEDEGIYGITKKYDDVESHSCSSTWISSGSDAPSCHDGISCCWTRTPKFRDLESENHPLLSRRLDRRFEPKTFKELVGQPVVVRSLIGALLTRRIAPLYVFHGPRGAGKSSAARVFTAALNCQAADEHKPCGRCQKCRAGGGAKEVDGANSSRWIRSLIKEAFDACSRFKIFIIDESHLMEEEAWTMIVNSLERLPNGVVFVAVTHCFDKVPRSAIIRSQLLHFKKVKDADVLRRLEDICLGEGVGFDVGALGFIASMANGSLRDASTMLDQLSLLGERITLPLARELVGVLSEEELLSLLDLALSSDTPRTVVRARELMSSRIDPLQLVSQLASLIMDIISGKSRGESEIRTSFVKKHAYAEKLNHALRVLTETEKQLRLAKNQTTWLTAALLQLNSSDPDSNPADFADNMMIKSASQAERATTMEMIWEKAIDLCRSASLKNFLRTRGRLSSLSSNEGMAVAVIEFNSPQHVSKAERSWKVIAGNLQSVMSRNVEIQIVLDPSYFAEKRGVLKKVSLGMFDCSRRIQEKAQADFQHRNFEFSDQIIEPKSPECGVDSSVGSALRSEEGNVLRVGGASASEADEEDDGQPRCFPKKIWPRRMLH